jgi:aspartyl-tRNA(Asn)/glutamyl-tRNA(Gln) amidotransferase subunit A
MVQDAFRKLFVNCDVLVSASRFGPASKIEEPLDGRAEERPEPKQRGLADLGAAGNLAGLPALALPCGFADGLPISIQLVGRPYSENTLLALGVEFQKHTDWHRRRPPVARIS